MKTTESSWNIKTISHLAFNVTDMEKSLAFYCDGFGFKKKGMLTFAAIEQMVLDRMKDVSEEQKEQAEAVKEHFAAMRDLPWLIYLEIAPGQFVELFYPMGELVIPEPLQDERMKRVGYDHLSLQVDDMKAAVEDLKAKGIMPTSEITFGPDYTYQCWFADPDGNRIELMEYTEKSLQVVGTPV